MNIPKTIETAYKVITFLTNTREYFVTSLVTNLAASTFITRMHFLISNPFDAEQYTFQNGRYVQHTQTAQPPGEHKCSHRLALFPC